HARGPDPAGWRLLRTFAPIAAFPTPVAAPLPAVAPRLRLRQQAAALGQIQNLALIEPRLDADHAVSGMSLRKAVIDIGAQSVQRELPLQVPFAARDFGSV